MTDFQQARMLAKLQMKKSFWAFFVFFPVSIAIAWLFSQALSTTDIPVLYDIFFLVTFWCMTVWLYPKEFQLQKVEEGFWASPIFIMLNQLAVKKRALIWSRMICYFLIAIPFNILVLVFLYSFSAEMRGLLPIGNYLAFSMIWLSFGIWAGILFPIADVGEKVPKNTFVHGLYCILFFGCIVALLSGLHALSGGGFVTFTIKAAADWPIISIALSIAAAAASFPYGQRYMDKQIRKTDYLK